MLSRRGRNVHGGLSRWRHLQKPLQQQKTAPSSDKVGQVSYSRTGTPKDIGKKPSSSEVKKRKHDAVGPNEKELKEFSQSLEQLLDHHEGDQQMVASDDLGFLFDEQNVSISFLDTSMEENEIVGSMLACIESQVKKDDRVNGMTWTFFNSAKLHI
ncbi:hypothetical protein GOP47_0022529 [Adiantum capillus-veneris]|uniref:Uncharacterized protein n=1 Tax=Adiantum capillus-veneris TaxID=13818 RepID=A0A9D4Z5L3_ADICA|nr:hypothetical protein GOP47_0022529 [Adiantum capillus-veneris]